MLNKFTEGYKSTKSQEKINHLLYMDDIKIFTKNKKIELESRTQTMRIYSQDIGMEFRIENILQQRQKRLNSNKHNILLEIKPILRNRNKTTEKNKKKSPCPDFV